MSNHANIRIYVHYYKETEIPVKNDLYWPVMAGNALYNTQNEQFITDDTGDHISDRNKTYSELTGIYWAWKNTNQPVVGSCHYRRYFTAQAEPFDHRLKRLIYYPVGLYKKRFGLIYTKNVKRFGNRILNAIEIQSILTDYDAILPQRRKLKYSVRQHYERYHKSEDLALLEQILENDYPEYLQSYSEIMQGKRLYANNMFVLNDEYFQAFMKWLFAVLFEFEKRTNINEYQGYQQRIFGFLGERLLTVWFHHHKLKVKELPVVYFKKLKY